MTTNVDLIVSAAIRHGVNPGVALAIAQGEGGLGTPAADGDYGYGSPGPTSFGPFQMHWHGAMPPQYWGNATASHDYANSEPGIDYAVASLAAAGGTAPDPMQAISNIVRNYERPAAPQPEIDRDIAWFRQHGSQWTAPANPAPPAYPPFPGQMSSAQGNEGSWAQLTVLLAQLGFPTTVAGGYPADPVGKAKEAHDALLYLSGDTDILNDYWGHYTNGHGSYDEVVGPKVWAFMAWLHTVESQKA